MDILRAIEGRRSTRRFKAKDIPQEILQDLLTAASRAPSPKNCQPWKFTIVQGRRKEEMIGIMREAIQERTAKGLGIGNALLMTDIMTQAPVLIFVHNRDGVHPRSAREADSCWWEIASIMSIGAAIENMLIAAQGKGLGSLWIGEIWKAYDELNTWLGEKTQLAAAIALGFPDETPTARPRKAISELSRWL